ncbi:MAG: hypothetical protein ACKOA0_07475 [Burkholderiaceae bacterium]
MDPAELDAEALYAQLEAQVLAGLLEAGDVAVVGIYSGGAWMFRNKIRLWSIANQT